MNNLEIFNMEGRVALVTGASSYGIGSVGAKAIASCGAKVFLVARREDKLKEVAAAIEADGGTVGYYACDVAIEEDCKAAVEACIAQFGRLDIMVLSAGIPGLSVSGGWDAVFDTDNWRKVNGINLDGVFFMIKHGFAECAKGGVGSIIPISSLAAIKAEGSPAYTSTKGALRSLTHNLAKAFGPMGIRVNTVYPGMIDTDMTHGAVTYEAYINPVIAATPLGRVGTAEDIGWTIMFLASDASSFITGQHFVVDGGKAC